MLIKIGSALINPEEIAAISPSLNDYNSAGEMATMIRFEFRNGGSIWIDATMDEAEAALIDAGVVTDLTAEQEADESPIPPLLDEEEVEELRKLASDGYEYLARDKDDKLWAFRRKPEYGGFYWSDPGPGGAGARLVIGFRFIGAEDEEPTDISKLLDDSF